MEGGEERLSREQSEIRSRFLRLLTSTKPIQNKKQVVEIIKNRFLLACVHDEAEFAVSKLARESLTHSIDRELVREELIFLRFLVLI